jgi:hypothetical protein
MLSALLLPQEYSVRVSKSYSAYLFCINLCNPRLIGGKPKIQISLPPTEKKRLWAQASIQINNIL